MREHIQSNIQSLTITSPQMTMKFVTDKHTVVVNPIYNSDFVMIKHPKINIDGITSDLKIVDVWHYLNMATMLKNRSKKCIVSGDEAFYSY